MTLKYLFDIPPFTALTKIIARYSNGTPKKEKDGSNKSEDVLRMWGHVNPEIVKKYGINPASKPEDYAEILLPLNRHDWIGKEWLSFHQIARWTNLKAELAGAGPDGTCYKDFKRFTPNEI